MRAILWFIIVNSVVLAIAGLFFKLAGSTKILGRFEPADARYFFSTFTYKNHWGAYCLLTLGVIGALTRYYMECARDDSRRSRSPVPVLILCSLLIGLTVPLSGSRSCSILYGLMLVCYIVQLCAHALPESLNRTQKFLVSSFAGLGLCLLLLLTSLAMHKETRDEMVRVTSRQIDNLKEGQLETRFYISRDTLKMYLEKPIWGWGLGTYRFVINDPGRFLGDEHEYAYIYAHNDWLQYMAETGVVGILLLAMLFAAPYILHRLKGMRNPVSSWLWGTVFLILSYSIVEFPCRTPAVSSLLTILIAAATKYSLLEQRHGRWSRRESERI